MPLSTFADQFLPMFRRLFSLACFSCWLAGCQTNVDIANFDEEAFRSDPRGCRGIRAAMRDTLFAVDSQFKRLTQEEIYSTLGKPDRQELASRSQKYFVYYIEAAPECPSAKQAAALPLTLYIRFSAMNRASEVKYENY